LAADPPTTFFASILSSGGRVAPAGLILKRGHDLIRVLSVLEARPRLVGA
jgi:hypothetical protein